MKFKNPTLLVTTAIFFALLTAAQSMPLGATCPAVKNLTVIDVRMPPAFTEYVKDVGSQSNGSQDSDDSQEDISHTLYFTSFKAFPPEGKVARITNIDDIDENEDSSFEDLNIEILADDLVWPNNIVRNDDLFSFPALIIPQGFLPWLAQNPGRLTALNLETLEEYPISSPYGPFYFYHESIFHDMNGDGLLDVITVRTEVQTEVIPSLPPPFNVAFYFYGELVWFENNGEQNKHTSWDEHILYPLADGIGPDTHLVIGDLDNDGVPEIVASSFFSTGVMEYDKGRVYVFGAGAPEGDPDWSRTDSQNIRSKVVVENSQGKPFSIEIVDVNGDDRLDLLMTNHQPVCGSSVLGRVFVVEQPSGGSLFGDGNWPVHVIRDGILPNQDCPMSPFEPRRLAPGFAKALFPSNDRTKKPWILVGGDQASKVWMMVPKYNNAPENWEYEWCLIYDIFDDYKDPEYADVSTIGDQFAIKSSHGQWIVYVPVYEANRIHVLQVAQRIEDDDNDDDDSDSDRNLRGSSN